jgi:hypothetical protein
MHMPSSSFVVRITLFWLFCSFCNTSCRKWVQVAPPENQLNMPTVFASDENAASALSGLYIHMMNNPRGLMNGGISLYGGLSSDELGCTGRNLWEYGFLQDTLSPVNPLCTGLYDSGYNLLFIANSLLNGLSLSTGVSASAKAQLGGEAKMIRALIYFYLVNLYGDVPLVLSTDYSQTALLPRSPVADVYAQIKNDIRDAQQQLSANYPSTAASPSLGRFRPNRTVATALLARVYLYTSDWSKADSAATAVIGNPLYRLESALDNVFDSTSQEAIWQLRPVYGNIATAEGNFFIPPTAATPPVYPLGNDLIEGFESADQRLQHWTAKNGNGARYPYKYKQRVAGAANPEYNMVIRLAEIYLIRAEARIREGDVAGGIADINVIRRRAGLAPIVTITPDDSPMAAVWRERQTELFTEWGHRWLDLKRSGQAGDVLAAVKPHWKSTAVLYPLPYSELVSNPRLMQNPGYLDFNPGP